MKHLETNYVLAFSSIKDGKVDFHEFMNLINKVYEFGFQRGVLHGIEKCQKELQDQNGKLIL